MSATLTGRGRGRGHARAAEARKPSASPRPGLILGALVLAMMAFTVVQTSVVPILPTLGEAFHLTTATVAWMMTANLLAAAVLTPLLGRMGDLYGRKWVLVLSVLGLVAGSALAYSVHSWPVLVAGRVLQGFGGGILPLAIAVIRDELPREKVTGAVSLVSASLGVGSGLSLVVTGWMMQHWSYQSVFLLGLILGLVALAAVLVAIKHDPVEDRVGSMDPLGALLLAVWLSALLLALSEGAAWGWHSASVLGLFVGAAVVLGLWIVLELRTAHPLVDVRVLARPAVAVPNVSGFCVGFLMYASFTLLSDFTQTPSAVGYGFSASILHSGILLLPSAVGSFLGAPIGARLIGRFGPKAPMALGGALAGLSMLFLGLWHGSQGDVYGASGVMGLGIGLAYAAMPAYINGAVPPEQAGIANSVNAVLRTVGGAVGTAVAGVVLTSSTISSALLAHTPMAGLVLPTGGAYRTAFLVCGVLGLAAAAVPLAVRARRP
ncbi:MFS transporter [Actinospica robiniae]|uniref:MFS transporter n=1 Tax=Actinospica robiniae TaxID=304901 RepID=UPI00041E1216|nr:MFS transporter [Actinospica robiniae]